MLKRITSLDFSRIVKNGLGLGIIVVDRDYHIALWNRWMEKHSGIRESDIIGQNIFDKFPDIRKRNKDCYIKECVDNQRSFLLSPLIHHYLIPLDIVKNDEHVRMFQNIKIYPFPNAEVSVGAVIIIRDLTEQVLHEKEILRLTRILKGIRNINQLIIRVKSEEELFTECCKILTEDMGYVFSWIGSAEEETFDIRPLCQAGTGHDIRKLKIGRDDSESDSGVISRAVRTGKTHVADPKFAREQGCRSVCALPLKADNHVIGSLNIYSEERTLFQEEELDLLEELKSDISFAIKTLRDRQKQQEAEAEKTKLEEQLQQSHKMEAIGTLASGIAHDFNNIIYPIQGYAELTLEEIPNDSYIRGNINEILKASNRARDLIHQILTFSRQGEDEFIRVQLHLIIKEVLQFLRASLPSTMEIRHNIVKCRPVMANPTQIHQIMINLCINAYHAMGENTGTLEVSLCETEVRSEASAPCPDMNSGPYIKLSVSDTGSGMDSETMDRIFEPYFTTKEIGKGTGMGLAVVHGIVKRCRGHISVHSEPGAGTTFDIYFPPVETEQEHPAKALRRSFPTGKEHILLVDDEADTVIMLGKVLEHLGYTVTAQTSSTETLEIFRRAPENFDLVITDQTMPRMAGDELSRELIRIRPDIPIILCTGFSKKITPENIQAIGIRMLLAKPVGTGELAEAIREILDKK
ncbi:ATP-binding protein [Desulfonema magnum]|uniref:histidine kinase n=1 Tax=Desulfonema magnum TaxID=45655 RepID=A0A975GPM2_9BACT|nr:ATP-binding protein [Desulfonema magnum]QTA88048.1 Two component system response regulator/histidine kinase, PAS and GAF domains-containing [Desulfonema magnum]